MAEFTSAVFSLKIRIWPTLAKGSPSDLTEHCGFGLK